MLALVALSRTKSNLIKVKGRSRDLRLCVLALKTSWGSHVLCPSYKRKGAKGAEDLPKTDFWRSSATPKYLRGLAGASQNNIGNARFAGCPSENRRENLTRVKWSKIALSRTKSNLIKVKGRS